MDGLRGFVRNWKKHSSPRKDWGGSLALLLVVVGVMGPVHNPPATHAYLERQAVALQPAFREELDALAQAPRYVIKASVEPETGSVAGQMRLFYTNTTQSVLYDLAFRLFPNAETIYGGGSLSVDRVTQGGIALRSELSEDQTVLRTPLAHPLEPGRMVVLELTFKAQVPARTRQGYGIFNRALGVLSLAGWYPVLATYDDGWQTPPVPPTGDAMQAETSLYEVSLTIPAGYEVISTGTLLRQEYSLQGVTWHLVSGPAREFAVAISDRFQKLETRAGEVTLRLYTLPAVEPAVAAAEAVDILANTFKAYVDRFGPYPFVEFDLVEAVVPIDGYEFSGMVYVDYAIRTQETREDYRYIVAHEVAHQWWYGLVGNHTVNEPWLDESFATYATVINLEDTESAQAGQRLLAYWRRTDGPRGRQDPPINSSTLGFASWNPYHATVYSRGAIFLHQLRREMGDEKFFELLKRYQRAYRYQIATTGDFFGSAEDVAGRDLDPLFEAWFETEAVLRTKHEDSAPSSPVAEGPAFSLGFPSRQTGPIE